MKGMEQNAQSQRKGRRKKPKKEEIRINTDENALGQCWHAHIVTTLGPRTNPRWNNVGNPTWAPRYGWRGAHVTMLAGKGPQTWNFRHDFIHIFEKRTTKYVHRWYNDGIRQRWPNVGSMLAFANVGPTLAQVTNPRWPNVICQRWPNVGHYVGPTLAQHKIVTWEGLSAF